ncbi:MAG: hypothetical protein Sapg2KO_31130 [Saprospiraceae bacterium]
MLTLFSSVAIAQSPTKTITDEDLIGNRVYNWSKDTTYLLNALVFVEDGSILNIEAGTVIKGLQTPEGTAANDNTSALIITRNAQIFAEGTAAQPIIFTGAGDDLTTTFDIAPTDNQLWGGLIILGNAFVGENGGQDNIEGIDSSDPRGLYGGVDNPVNDDNSGTLRYVSIRHGGAVLGADNEINGVTLGGVGSGTIIDYIEVFGNKDDGIEFFGGTVNVKHAVVAFVGDDSYDFDESYSGSLQYIFSMQQSSDASIGDHAVEYDGTEDNSADAVQFAGKIYNATFIGAGATATNTKSDGVTLRKNAALQMWNSIITGVPGYAFKNGEDEEDENEMPTGGFVNPADLTQTAFANNIVFDNNNARFIEGADGGFNALVNASTETVDPQLAGISRVPNGQLDPRPNAGSPALSGAAIPTNIEEDFDIVGYRGAFNNRENWAAGWTAMDEYGYFGDLVTEASNVITDASINAGETLVLDNSQEWVLDGFVFVEDGAELIIQPGTVIKGLQSPNTGDLTSALIISRGGKITAEGNANNPIIFTGTGDDLSTIDDVAATDNQLWGGVIILGKAFVGENGGTDNIEGIDSNEPRGIYGGSEDDDNSGTLKYVSIRHGGAVLGADNEINGLTLGGVGSGTTIDYVEIFGNKDDGIEFFGGTVNVTHAVVAFVGDDSYDFDESYDGHLQYIFSIQQFVDASIGDHAIEYDGTEDNTANAFQGVGRVYNATFIGPGANATDTKADGITLRKGAALELWNSILVDIPGYTFKNGEDEEDENEMPTGGFVNPADLTQTAFANNIVNNINADRYFEGADRTNFVALLTSTLDTVPGIRGISTLPNEGLDPRLNSSAAANRGAAIPVEAGVDTVSYRGAFDDNTNWALGWTALDEYQYFGLLTNTVEYASNSEGVSVNAYPNPVLNGVARLQLELPTNTNLLVNVFSLTGQNVLTHNFNRVNAGTHNLDLNVSNFQTGMYIVAIQTGSGTVTRKINVNN